MSRTLEILTAIKTTLDGASFAWADEVQTGFRVRKKLEDLPGATDQMSVVVQPSNATAERLTRGGLTTYDHEYVVEFARRVDMANANSDPTVIGAMVGWVEQAVEYLLANDLAGDGATLASATFDTVFDREAFDEQNTFYARAVLTYRDMR